MDQCLQATVFGMFCKLVKIRLPGKAKKTEQRRDKVCRKRRRPIISVRTSLPSSMSVCSWCVGRCCRALDVGRFDEAIRLADRIEAGSGGVLRLR